MLYFVLTNVEPEVKTESKSDSSVDVDSKTEDSE